MLSFISYLLKELRYLFLRGRKPDPYITTLLYLSEEAGYVFTHPLHEVTDPRNSDPLYWTMIGRLADHFTHPDFPSTQEKADALARAIERMRGIWPEIHGLDILSDIDSVYLDLTSSDFPLSPLIYTFNYETIIHA